jgi:hypothetical protein
VRLHRCRTPVPTLKKQRRREKHRDCVGLVRAHREKPLWSADVAKDSDKTPAAAALVFLVVPFVLMGLGLNAGWGVVIIFSAAFLVAWYKNRKGTD